MDLQPNSLDGPDGTSTELAGLFAAHAPGLIRWMTTFTRDGELAEDLVQDAFVRLARELQAGRRPDNPPAWLALVTRNLAVSRARRNATAVRFEARLEHPAPAIDPAASALANERAAAVHAALATLRPVDRRALLLAAEGHRTVDIAADIGRTELATRALLCRARRRIRPVLRPIAAG